ncbi:protein disulfide isomerase pTAC5, chloroplastic-like isoform X2 [Phragmites australis]|uniref:protein disulfide isomerase pTAC5, chloroplastic-like isoform X2 n=1 Tax=Phragmites australis TaxID=29695 RepID=UPI002D795A29|nr:protein disulfide isomerase pTAC5, chloroplastic-like isoform X2 [Phragmites australis]
MITAASTVAAATFPFLSSFHRPRLRPCPSRVTVLFPARATGSSSSWEQREEARWLREEQRWLREEQRWLREESRWRAEREALLTEIAALRLRLRALEGPPSHLAAVDAVASPAPPAAVPAPQPRSALVEEVEVRKEVVMVEEKKAKTEAGSGTGSKSRRTLRAGAEGEDVRAMQEALQKLGFYSGEEDMEYSSFSSGTELAVKTWQATVGTSEDGVMTSELLEMLFTGKTREDVTAKDGINGAAAPAVTGIAEVRQTVVTENGVSGVGVSEHRVFLLGENRWEDPSRLTQKKKPTSTGTAASTKTCISCRGEGRLMCTECDGSGEPNIEPQFLEWVGEDTKCTYCEGLGSIVCDVCEGKKVMPS